MTILFIIVFFHFLESDVSTIRFDDGVTKYWYKTISLLPVARVKIPSSHKHGISKTLSSK